jgi:hypothetical protein
MTWRIFKRFRLGAGVNANLSSSGIGWSWGFAGFRVGVSGSGRKWISIGIPGTGLYFYKTIGYRTGGGSTDRSPNYETADEEIIEQSADTPRPKGPTRWRNIK